MINMTLLLLLVLSILKLSWNSTDKDFMITNDKTLVDEYPMTQAFGNVSKPIHKGGQM